jgi:predicted molibdopterin-dependent oxidoreductase YjgC
MFRPRPDAARATIAVEVEGRTVRVPEGASAAAAVLLAGLPSLRDTPVAGSQRAPYCMMGVCFDCLAEIDGVANRRSCMTAARSGMRIRRQRGARRIDVPEIAGSHSQ